MRQVRINEPSQMLGVIDADLRDAMGVDVTGVFRRGTKWGFPAERVGRRGFSMVSEVLNVPETSTHNDRRQWRRTLDSTRRETQQSRPVAACRGEDTSSIA